MTCQGACPFQGKSIGTGWMRRGSSERPSEDDEVDGGEVVDGGANEWSLTASFGQGRTSGLWGSLWKKWLTRRMTGYDWHRRAPCGGGGGQ
jgi:hypothetical protein